MFTIRVKNAESICGPQPTMYLEPSYYVKPLPSLSRAFAIKLGYQQS